MRFSGLSHRYETMSCGARSELERRLRVHVEVDTVLHAVGTPEQHHVVFVVADATRSRSSGLAILPIEVLGRSVVM